MASLNNQQWESVNRMALRIHASESRENLVRLAIDEVPSLIGTRWGAWNEHDTAARLERVFSAPEFLREMAPRFPLVNALMDTHPIVEGMALNQNLELHDGVFTLTDFKSERELRNVPMWHEVYRHVEARHQMLAQFFVGEDYGVALTLNSDRPFTEEQRTMVSLLRDHFVVACRRHLTREAVEKHLRNKQQKRLLARLSCREREVLPYLLAGKTNPEIAIILSISPRTVEKHVASILDKAGVENRRMLMAVLLPLHGENG